MKYATYFYWNDNMIANDMQADLPSDEYPAIQVSDGLLIVKTANWARAFPADRILYLHTSAVER